MDPPARESAPRLSGTPPSELPVAGRSIRSYGPTCGFLKAGSAKALKTAHTANHFMKPGAIRNTRKKRLSR
jgi:hypothetical protein